MLIDFSKIDTQLFSIKEDKIAGDKCCLVTPKHNAIEWTKDNLIFRSSIWDYRGRPVSLSYKKFFNLEEKQWLTSYLPKKFYNRGINIVEKIDGSTLIVSRYKGITIMRTRGSFNAMTMPNGDELELFKSKYPKFFAHINQYETLGSSYIFEWVSPRNIIVMPHTEPGLYLTNLINHEDYSLYSQAGIDTVAEYLGLKRPARYSFYSINDMIKNIEPHQGIEGVCVYFNNDQEIKKCKSNRYVILHAFKSNLSLKSLLEVYLTEQLRTQEDLELYIETTTDWECLQAAKPLLPALFKILTEFNKEIEEVTAFTEVNKDLDQKSFALKAKETYGNNPYKGGFCFSLKKVGLIQEESKKKILLEKIKQYKLRDISLKEA